MKHERSGVRFAAPWMCQADERILKRLDKSGVGTAWEIAYDLDRRVGHIRRWCLVLADADFVDVVRRENHGDQYAITDAGRGYLFVMYDANYTKATSAGGSPAG